MDAAFEQNRIENFDQLDNIWIKLVKVKYLKFKRL